MKDKANKAQNILRMGWMLVGMALTFSTLTFLTPTSTIGEEGLLHWLSAEQKTGVYAVSALFLFLGLYCLGGVWRKRNFI